MGIKERRTKILLALFLLSDVDFSFVSLDERVQKIFDLSLNQKTSKELLNMIKEEIIEKNATATNSYRLTQTGFSKLCLEFPLFRFLREKWDGKWRVISYEIPESKREIRDRLRREMQGWGLGPWHRSFWLTPHPIIARLKEIVLGREEEKYIQAFESEHIFGDRGILIEKVWGTIVLDSRYRALFKKWHEILSSPEEKTTKATRVVADYIVLLRQDPGLPVELVGEKWIGREAFDIFKEIKAILFN